MRRISRVERKKKERGERERWILDSALFAYKTRLIGRLSALIIANSLSSTLVDVIDKDDASFKSSSAPTAAPPPPLSPSLPLSPSSPPCLPLLPFLVSTREVFVR